MNTPGKPRGALAGFLAALAGLTAAEVAAVALPGRPSPVLSIAAQIISLTPADVREQAISTVGTADKPLLTSGILIVILLSGTVVGVWRRADARGSWPVFAVMAAVIAVFTVTYAPNPIIGAVPAVVGGAVGYCVYAALLRTGTRLRSADAVPDAEPLSRRTFVLASAGIGIASAAGIAVLAGIRTTTVRAVETARAALTLPVPATAAPPLPTGAAVDLEGMPPPLTPSPQFYRIDTALTPPAVDVDSWTLTISGMVSAPITYTYADLMAMPQVSKYVTLACISNEVGGDLVGNALWQGVPLTALLKAAGVSPAADQIMGMSVDGFTAGFPTALAFDGREPLLALGMNGEPLPVDHGFPARLVVPGLYGYVSATKWISEIRLTTFADEEGFWVRRGWISDGRIAMASRIDVPAVGAKLNAGPMTIAGRAWHQTVPIGRVELSIDNGPWKPAVLADSMGLDCWRLWSYSWDAPAGEHRIEVRMTDADGAVQSAQITAPGPGPSSGYDRITVTIR